MTQSLSFKWIVVCALASSSLIVKRLLIGLNNDNFTNSKYLLHRHLEFKRCYAHASKQTYCFCLLSVNVKNDVMLFSFSSCWWAIVEIKSVILPPEKKTAFVSFKFCDCLKLFFASPGKLFPALNIDFESTIVVRGGQEIIIKNIVFVRFVFLFG